MIWFYCTEWKQIIATPNTLGYLISTCKHWQSDDMMTFRQFIPNWSKSVCMHVWVTHMRNIEYTWTVVMLFKVMFRDDNHQFIFCVSYIVSEIDTWLSNVYHTKIDVCLQHWRGDHNGTQDMFLVNSISVGKFVNLSVSDITNKIRKNG